MEFERRQYERQKLYSPEYFDMDADNGGMVVDLSEDGLGFQAVGRVEKGREITVSFSLGTGYRISARARIAWVGLNGNSGGTTFTRLPADSRSIIREWLTKTAEAAAAHEAAAAVESQISTRSSEPEVSLIIERIETAHVPISARPAPMELTPQAFVAAEPEVQPDLEPIVQSIAELSIQSVAQQVIDKVVQSIAAPAVPPAIESVAEPAAAFVAAIVPPVVQSVEEAVAETPQAAGEELPDSSAPGLLHQTPHAIPPDNSAEIPPETSAALFPEMFAQDTRNSPEIVEAPAEQVQAEAPLPPFPPRNERELFTRSPWISGQSLPEEKRSRKGLIAVIVICAIVAAAIASVPYAHSHRQQIGAAIISMGRSVAGQPAPNAAEQSPQPSQAAPQSSASSSAASGAAIPINPPAVAAKPLGNTAPSASTVAPAPSGLQTPASEVHPNASPNVKTSAALAADTGQTEFRRAQQYLNGTGGVVADPVEAAEWFWRSLEKGNTGAAIPLSDLYLQGKGVSQSCLQARILLTTASHKGNAEAIQKLLQLPENCEQ